MTFSISIISSTPRLAAYTAPDQDHARGSPSSPMSATLERSTDPRGPRCLRLSDREEHRCRRRRARPRIGTRAPRETHEVAVELFVQTRAGVRAELAGDVHAVSLAELRTHARWNQIERRLVQRRALKSVKRAVGSVAVFLEAALQQDHQRRLATGRRAEQQQQSSPDVGARCRRLEVIDDAIERGIDAEQLTGKQLLLGAAAPRRAVCASRYQHSMS